MTKLFMLCVLCFLLSFVSSDDAYPNFSSLEITGSGYGPDSVAFDLLGGGPYVTINDGRILKYCGPYIGFQDFAYTSPNRSKALCDGTTDTNLAPTCGKGFALTFNSKLNLLFVTDVFRGLLYVEPLGGLAKVAVNTAEGGPIHFANGVDFDPTTGNLVFIDTSLTYDYRDIGKPGFVADSTGRLILHNFITNQTKVLLKDLYSPAGPAFSDDGTFILVTLTGDNTVIKYWLEGPKATTTELLLKLPGAPRKIKRAFESGEFWVPYFLVSGETSFISPHAYKIASNGTVLLEKDFTAQYPDARVTVVFQNSQQKIYTGSRLVDFVGKYEK